MYGSSASNEYGNGGTVKATGFSSRVRFESELFAVPARKRPGAAVPAPSNPAPTIPVFNKKLRRFMGTPAMRNVSRPAGRIIQLGRRYDNSAGESHDPASLAKLQDSRQPAGPRDNTGEFFRAKLPAHRRLAMETSLRDFAILLAPPSLGGYNDASRSQAFGSNRLNCANLDSRPSGPNSKGERHDQSEWLGPTLPLAACFCRDYMDWVALFFQLRKWPVRRNTGRGFQEESRAGINATRAVLVSLGCGLDLGYGSAAPRYRLLQQQDRSSGKVRAGKEHQGARYSRFRPRRDCALPDGWMGSFHLSRVPDPRRGDVRYDHGL